MPVITDKFLVRSFFFAALIMGNFHFMGQGQTFRSVQGYFGVTSQDAMWLLRGFQSGTIITGIAGLVFIKWLGNRNLFIGGGLILLIATIYSFTAKEFNVLLISRIAGGIANGFMIAVSMQMYLATYEGKTKVVGALNAVAASVSGMLLGLLANSLFTEDYGWQFIYYLGLPLLVPILILAFFFVPKTHKNEEIEEDWISIIPFSFLIVSLFFIVLFRQQYTGLGNPKILAAVIIAIVSASLLLIRGFVHPKPLFDTRLLQYPGFVVAFIISFLAGAAFVFNLSMLGRLLGGILKMPLADVFHFINFLVLVLFAMLVVTIILIAKKFSPYWLMIIGFLAIAYTAFTFSGLNTEFSLDNVIRPSVIGIAGCGIIMLTVVLIAVKSVPPPLIGKVANFRSVAFSMGIALTATDIGAILDVEQVKNFNLMIRYTDPGNPLLQERLNGLTAFYQSNGYDAIAAQDAANNAVTGMLTLQSFFLSLSETLLIGAAVCLALAFVVFILWVVRNYQMIIDFITFKNIADDKLPTETGKV